MLCHWKTQIYIPIYTIYVSSWKKSTSDIVQLNTTYIYKKFFLSFPNSLKSLGKTCFIWLILSTFFPLRLNKHPNSRQKSLSKPFWQGTWQLLLESIFPGFATIKLDEEREKFGSANFCRIIHYFWPNNHHVHIKPQVYS